MTVRRPDRPRWILLPSVCLLVAVAAGCGGVDPHTASPPSPRTSMFPTTPVQQPSSTTATAADGKSRAVIDAYQGMWADMVDAARTADYRSPSLAAHTVDPATGQLQRTLLAYSRLGVVVKGTLRTDPHLTSLNPELGQATLTDCLDDRNWLTYDAATGKLTDNQPGARTVTDATLRRVDGAWKVSSYVVHVGQSC